MPAPVDSRSFLMSAAVTEAMSLLVSGRCGGPLGITPFSGGRSGGRLVRRRRLDRWGRRVGIRCRRLVAALEELLLPLGQRLVGAELAGLGLLVAGGARAGASHQALGDRVGDDSGEDLDAADRVVVAGDLVVDDGGVAVGVEDRDDRDAELARLVDGEVLLVGVDDPDRAGGAGHVTDAAEGALELDALAAEDQRLLLRQHGLAAGRLDELELLEALQ